MTESVCRGRCRVRPAETAFQRLNFHYNARMDGELLDLHYFAERRKGSTPLTTMTMSCSLNDFVRLNNYNRLDRTLNRALGSIQPWNVSSSDCTAWPPCRARSYGDQAQEPCSGARSHNPVSAEKSPGCAGNRTTT